MVSIDDERGREYKCFQTPYVAERLDFNVNNLNPPVSHLTRSETPYTQKHSYLIRSYKIHPVSKRVRTTLGRPAAH